MPQYRPSPLPPHANAPLVRGQVIKRLTPGAAGTKQLLKRFGTVLVCVRYRLDEAGSRRFTTVELIVDERPTTPRPALVRIAYKETELRRRVKDAGGEWDARLQLWRLPKAAVKKLGLADRVVKHV